MTDSRVTQIAILPYALSLIPLTLLHGPPPFACLLVASVIQTMLLEPVAATIGLWLGPKVGLGKPDLEAWLASDP